MKILGVLSNTQRNIEEPGDGLKSAYLQLKSTKKAIELCGKLNRLQESNESSIPCDLGSGSYFVIGATKKCLFYKFLPKLFVLFCFTTRFGTIPSTSFSF